MSVAPPANPTPARAWKPPSLFFRFREAVIEWLLAACGFLSIIITVTIALMVIYESVEFFRDREYDQKVAQGIDPGRDKVSVSYFLTGTEWTAGYSTAKYGILPLLSGTVLVALIAAAVSIPLGLTTAIYLSEYSTPRIRGFVKPTLEILAGIPTVVYGYFALTTVTPFLAYFIPGLSEPTNQLSGGIVVGIMILPMVASLSEDAIRSVPRSLREGSYALGANQFETSSRVVVPAALSGIFASFILAISRAIGETMAVSLACGYKPELSIDPRQGLATMTSFIVRIAGGDVQHGSTDFNSLFAVAGVLFFLTLGMNILAQWIVKRYRQVYQ
jgi:phosphate transport system permease protein